ncbi:hypothetical protein HanIR_Chr13g0667071 [Helianthus annuus]|nr:hypothetical protein HanIR_Chr13g0667071 [Helianthus annuus]
MKKEACERSLAKLEARDVAGTFSLNLTFSIYLWIVLYIRRIHYRTSSFGDLSLLVIPAIIVGVYT